MSEHFSTQPTPPKLGNQLGLLIGMYLLMQVLVAMIALLWLGADKATNNAPPPKLEEMWLILIAVQTIMSFFVPVLIWARVHKQTLTTSQMMGVRFPLNGKILFWSVILLAINYPIMDLLVSANIHFISTLPADSLAEINKIYSAQNQFFVELFTMPIPHVWRSILLVVVVAVIPAVCEELFFRGALQKILTQRMHSKLLAIGLTALIFSLIHVEFYGFLLRFVMGCFLGYVFFKTNNIVYSIVLHFLFNASQVVMMVLTPEAEMVSSMHEKATYMDEYPLWSSMAIVVSLILTYFVYNRWRAASASNPN